MVKEGAAVIDVGINHIHDPLTGKTTLVGDVDFEGQWDTLYAKLSDKRVEVGGIRSWIARVSKESTLAGDCSDIFT